MNNCSLTEDDQLIIRMLTKEETVELFGEDYLEEYGQEVPEEVLKEYKEVMGKFSVLQRKLRSLRRGID